MFVFEWWIWKRFVFENGYLGEFSVLGWFDCGVCCEVLYIFCLLLDLDCCCVWCVVKVIGRNFGYIFCCLLFCCSVWLIIVFFMEMSKGWMNFVMLVGVYIVLLLIFLILFWGF